MAAEEKQEKKNTHLVTVSSASGRQRVVERENPEGEPFVPDMSPNRGFVANQSYIDAHGPAEPIRGRYMRAEQTHPALAVDTAIGTVPDTLVIPAMGRNVPAEVNDPAVNLPASDVREALENSDRMPDDAGDAVQTDALGASTNETVADPSTDDKASKADKDAAKSANKNANTSGSGSGTTGA